MVVTAPLKKNKRSEYPFGEQRVVFHHLSWDDYLAMLAAVGDNRSARFTYDRGKLEITMPLEAHEFAGEMIARFIWILVEELGSDIKSMGSTTLNYPQLEKGAEPDKGFYLQNHHLVSGKKVDLEKDPPPDLVVEVDITHTDIDKPALYAAMGIQEFWRFDGESLRIFMLKDGVYQEEAASPTFPRISKEQLYQFLAESAKSEVQASRNLRRWIQALLKK
ncbi:MAG: Uma2 family endonuclease [Cyanobacteria bacterium J06597_16]